MRRLTILITNSFLAHRTGSELYVKEVATALIARGHRPVVYSTQLGDVAAELRWATVPVVDDLARITVAPDIIHGQHHLETMAALLHFPGVPAIFFCHGWLPWEELPPRSPRILRYVAVDETCLDRLVLENGIPEHRVRVRLNFVDLARFRPREPLPARPRRALVFDNSAAPGSYVETVREACARADLPLDVIGMAMGNATSRAEEVLPRYDVVFARGRAALEALAVGTSVVLCSFAGLGPMVTSADLERLRRLNFGIRAQPDPFDADLILRQLARYDARDAAAVSAEIRASAGQQAAIDEIVSIYQEVLAEHEAQERAAPEEEWRAAAAYLRSLALELSASRRALGAMTDQRDHLSLDLDATRRALGAAVDERDHLSLHLRQLRETATFRLRARLLRLPGLGKLATGASRLLSSARRPRA
jgi:Glycosyltransferase Family 4